MSEALKLKPKTEIKLVILKGPHAGQRFSFSKNEVTIGRAPENDIVLLNDPLISRHHAKLIIAGNDVEIINLSEKNSIIVQGEIVQKWKLINSATFLVGETEFQIQFDLGQIVVPVKSQVSLQVLKSPLDSASSFAPKDKLQIIPAKKKENPPQVKNTNLQLQKQAMQLQKKQMQNHLQNHRQNQNVMPQQQPNGNRQPTQNTMQFQAGLSAPPRKAAKSNFTFYVVLVAIVGVSYYFFGLDQKKVKKSIDKKTVLKYSDEVQIKLNSKSEKENQKKLEKLLEMKNSPMVLRAQENFIKGMRDYQLGNYTRAQEFFQVVLNLQPGHELAKRHLYLSKVRFDEVLKAKLMLGESYYQKHNFKMCQSMYEQVLNMLQGRSSDQNFQIASAMIDKCKLALEGVL